MHDASPEEQGAEPRDPIRQWHDVAKRTFLAVGIFSVFVNLLMLTMPIFLFQISDRVLTSRTMDTVLILSLLALGFILLLSLLNALRRQVLGRLATKMETILGGPVIASIVASAPASDSGNMLPLRSLHQVRGFMSSPTMVVLFDAPLAPLYFAAVFLIHPSLGFATLAAGGLLFGIAVLNQRATSGLMSLANAHAPKADAQADALARNAQVINAMGMLNESILQWWREQTGALTKQMTAQGDLSVGQRCRLAVQQPNKPDPLTPQRPSYLVRVRLDQAKVREKVHAFQPTPGMPADVFIKTGERAFFEYIMRPVRDSFSRAYRES